MKALATIERSADMQTHNFTNLTGTHLSKAQAGDLVKKQFIKLQLEAKQIELETKREALKRRIAEHRDTIELKKISKELKQVRGDAQKATAIYLGAVSNALVDYEPGKPIAQKLALINQKQLEESHD